MRLRLRKQRRAAPILLHVWEDGVDLWANVDALVADVEREQANPTHFAFVIDAAEPSDYVATVRAMAEEALAMPGRRIELDDDYNGEYLIALEVKP